jgi:hypothetical protein
MNQNPQRPGRSIALIRADTVGNKSADYGLLGNERLPYGQGGVDDAARL